MYDELTDESVFMQLPVHKQTELISHYCVDIKEKINKSLSQDEAQTISDVQCKQFEMFCQSRVIQKAMRKYVQHIIVEKWTIAR